MSDLHVRLRWGTSSWNCLILAAVHVLWGVSLIVQPHRWTATPAYYNLFHVIPEFWWGVIYLVASVLLAVGVYVMRHRRRLWVIQTAITVNFVLTSAWGLAFVVRYLTNPSTTPFTFGSSVIQIYLLVRASIWLTRESAPLSLR
ncbi:MAG: hypothetical protein M3O28_00820 [Actinomycetota bacterium]|nr:hypothetical protein [Actinomycetota bacterium]